MKILDLIRKFKSLIWYLGILSSVGHKPLPALMIVASSSMLLAVARA